MSAADATPRFELNVIQLIAGALAAVTAAVVSSFFGVGGTVIGAGIASLVATLGAAVYTHSIRRTQARLLGAKQSPPVPGVYLPGQRPGPRPHRRSAIRWQTVAVSAVLVFGLAMTAITGVEAAAGKSLWALVTNHSARSGGSTTIGDLAQPAPTAAAPATPAPREAPAVVPSDNPGRPTTRPSATPSTLPSGEPTPGF